MPILPANNDIIIMVVLMNAFVLTGDRRDLFHGGFKLDSHTANHRLSSSLSRRYQQRKPTVNSGWMIETRFK